MNPTSASAAPDRLDPRRLAEFGIIALYGLMLALVLPEHEPWTDEAQAWLLARDASYWDLLAHRLRYEGTPALWHLLLSVPAKLGLPYIFLNIVGALSALVGTIVLVRYSPFPLWLRALLPFTYFLGFQYAVVARNYCLLPPLFFGLALAARRREENYWPYAVLLVLISHVSLHATLLAGAIWLFEVGVAFAGWRRGETAPWRLRLAPLAVLSASFVLILVQLKPPADLLLRPPYEWPLQLQLFGLVTREVMVWWLPGAFVLLAALLPLFRAGRVLGVMLTGLLFVYALLCLRYFARWHTGVIFVFLIFGCWLALDRLGSAPLAGWRRWARPTALGALAAVALPSLVDTCQAAYHDYYYPYSSSLRAAAYIQAKKIDQRKLHAFDINSFALQPYFERNIFANFQNPDGGSYWVWCDDWGMRRLPENVMKERPEYILVTQKWPDRLQMQQMFLDGGYVVERDFDANIFWKRGVAEIDKISLLRRKDLPE